MTNNLFELGLDQYFVTNSCLTDRFFLADTDSLILTWPIPIFINKDHADNDTNFSQAKNNKPIPIFKRMTMYYDKLKISLLSETNVFEFKIS